MNKVTNLIVNGRIIGTIKNMGIAVELPYTEDKKKYPLVDYIVESIESNLEFDHIVGENFKFETTEEENREEKLSELVRLQKKLLSAEKRRVKFSLLKEHVLDSGEPSFSQKISFYKKKIKKIKERIKRIEEELKCTEEKGI